MEDIKNIQNLASKCLNCKKPMCKTGCPIATNIPEFIAYIKKEDYLDAYKILQENNIMSEICSTICPTENQCMGKCIQGIRGNPVSIKKLENFVNKWAKKNNINFKIENMENNNKKIAVIGAGPAGISCAIELAKKGYKVTIFEKENDIGGILEYEIPDFRLPKATLEYIREKIKEAGISLKTNFEFGKNFNLEDLKKEGFEAVFLGLGAYLPNIYKLTSEECYGIYKSSEILRKYYNREKIENLGKVIVIGGGNVAMDSARVINKMGAEKVTIVYRRNRKFMPAITEEIEDALAEGINIVYNTRVVGVEVKNKEIESVRCIRTKIENEKAVDIENSNYEIEAKTVVFAIGLGIDENLFKKLGIEIENGLVKIDENYMTNIPGIFVGGDLVAKKQTACKAIATGKKAANGIEKYLQ